MELLLHSGIEHPNTLWVAISATIAFALGLGVGAYGRAVSARFTETIEEAN
jgi:demethoxyubiquinone hydroxylase (CLK1/Coq7/Cat5 family)